MGAGLGKCCGKFPAWKRIARFRDGLKQLARARLLQKRKDLRLGNFNHRALALDFEAADGFDLVAEE
ncbi:MAG: hypothetical protein ACREMU_14340, partial [Gemmatimonadaceae bacterium]